VAPPIPATAPMHGSISLGSSPSRNPAPPCFPSPAPTPVPEPTRTHVLLTDQLPARAPRVRYCSGGHTDSHDRTAQVTSPSRLTIAVQCCRVRPLQTLRPQLPAPLLVAENIANVEASLEQLRAAATASNVDFATDRTIEERNDPTFPARYPRMPTASLARAPCGPALLGRAQEFPPSHTADY
jgi:hypothetical protein